MSNDFASQFVDEDNNPFEVSISNEANDSRDQQTAAAGPEAGESGDSGDANGNGTTTGATTGGGDGDSNGDASVLLFNTPKSTQIIESRVSKLLKPSSNVKTQISEANNSSEGMLNSLKKYIVYTIRLINVDTNEEIHTRRRYSDFESLRKYLTRIFPLIIIPPIPPKNYIDLSILNIVKNGENSNKKELGYSYINSSHLTSMKLIDHRKRLLSNFLNNCLKIKQIRNLEFFAKFLDPNTNWQDEINLISNHLPKDIYHLNPENGLKTDPIYGLLPHPTNNINMGFLTSILSNGKKLSKKIRPDQSPTQHQQQPVDDEDLDLSPKISHESDAKAGPSINTSKLDEINKKIMVNFSGLANDYMELGTVFNSFSLVLADAPIIRTKSKSDEEANGGKLNIILDKMGQVFDRSYITINALIGELETKFSEPLGEEVQYTTSLKFVQKYQRRKIRQQAMLDEDLKDKRQTLETLLKSEEETSNIESAIRNDPVARNNNYLLNQPPASSYKFKIPNMTSIKKITQYVSDIMDQHPEQTRKQKIIDLNSKISTLEKCQGIMLEDISYIADELNKNFHDFHKNQLKVIYDILLSYNGYLVSWAKKNLDIWEEIREEILKL